MNTHNDMKNISNWYPLGKYECDRYVIEKKIFEHSVRTKISPEYHGQEEGDEILILQDKYLHEVVMSNSQMEVYTNDWVENAHGDVLIAGLGICMIIKTLQENPLVNNITIIEKSKELIDFIMPIIRNELSFSVSIINEDIFDYEPTQTFDCIYFDIWNDISPDNLVTMDILYAKFNPFKTHKDSFIGSWRYLDTWRMFHSEDILYRELEDAIEDAMEEEEEKYKL